MPNIIFWKQLRSGELRYQERPPSKRPFVAEQMEQVEWQHYKHTLTLVTETAAQTPVEFHSYCGYDRGPKHKAILLDMLRRAL